MKAGFSFSKRYVPTWRGNDKLDAANQFVAILQMPDVQDVFSVLDRLQSFGFTGKVKQDNLSMEQLTGLAKEAGHYCKKYVKLENAEDFTIDDVVKYPPFFNLTAELLFALIEFAQPSEQDEKN